MAMSPILKFGLLGGAAFVAWRQFAAPAAEPVTTPAPFAIAPPTGTTAPPPTVLVPPAVTAVAAALPLTDEVYKRASWDPATAAILADRVRFSVHQWNFWREHSGGGRANPGSDLSQMGADPNTPITASEYLARLSQVGLGRLQGLRRR